MFWFLKTVFLCSKNDDSFYIICVVNYNSRQAVSKKRGNFFVLFEYCRLLVCFGLLVSLHACPVNGLCLLCFSLWVSFAFPVYCFVGRVCLT